MKKDMFAIIRCTGRTALFNWPGWLSVANTSKQNQRVCK